VAITSRGAEPRCAPGDGRRPETALAEIEKLERDGRLSGYQYLRAIKADLLSRLGRTSQSAAAYRQALALATNEAERAFLAERIADHTFSA
jgi:RNA polymerase sigma-70 factor (ECF subfamily)